MPNSSRTITDARNAMTMLASPTSDNYRTQPVMETFDWSNIVNHASSIAAPRSGKYYLVVFRSKLKSDTDPTLVAALDEAAHTEAKRSPDLMYYFAGTPKHLLALSWCL